MSVILLGRYKSSGDAEMIERGNRARLLMTAMLVGWALALAGALLLKVPHS